MKVKFFALILLVVFLSSPVSVKKVDKLFLVYMAADNNLYMQGMGDIFEMKKADKRNTKVIALVDDKSSTRIEEITDREEIIEEKSNENTGDPETFLKFLNFALSSYQANRIILVMWGHGDGRNFKGKEGKGICFDETHSDFLTIKEIREVLKKIKERYNKKIDILIFDACFMQSIEVSYELKDYVNFILGSQTYVPLDGIPYDKVISVVSRSNSNIKDLSIDIAKAYFNSYNNGSQGNENITFSVIDPFYTEEVKEFVRKIIPQLISMDDVLFKRERYVIPMNEKYVDFVSFIKNSLRKGQIPGFNSLIKKLVIVNFNNFNRQEYFNGVSIYFPPYFFPINLNFFTDSGWEEFLWHKFSQ